MSMAAKSFSGNELEESLRTGTTSRASHGVVGMVQAAEERGHIQFTQSDCENWVTVPVKMIDGAETVGQARCRGHTHPVMRLTFKEPADPDARVLLALLTQAGAPEFPDSPAPAMSMTSGVAEMFGEEGANQGPVMGAASPSVVFRQFGGFGPTLPTCRWVRKWVPCGSALPGYPVPMCLEWIQECRFPGSSRSLG